MFVQHHGEKTGEQAKESWLKRCEKDRQEEEQKENYTDTQGHFHKVGRGVSSWGVFSFDFFLKFCVDVDECVPGKHDCPAERECVNTLGSYQCSHCRPGYIDDGETCQGKICIQ